MSATLPPLRPRRRYHLALWALGVGMTGAGLAWIVVPHPPLPIPVVWARGGLATVVGLLAAAHVLILGRLG